MPTALRLEITDYHSPTHFDLRLTGSEGNTLGYHSVRLDADTRERRAYLDLPHALRRKLPNETEMEVLTTVGDWLGVNVFGTLLQTIADNSPAGLKTIEVVVPNAAHALLNLPLDAARYKGRTLAEQNIRLNYVVPNAPIPTPKPTHDTLRMLAVFSLPSAESPLNLRQERYRLEEWVRGLRADGQAVELRVLQYGATRQTLADALSDGDGWDILHFSGHGTSGVLLLEKPDGTPDPITTNELEQLVEAASERVKLIFLSACLSGATTLRAARQAVGLDAPTRDNLADANSPSETVSAPEQTSVGQRLAERLHCATVAMRYSVNDRFASDLALTFYDGLMSHHQPLPRALNNAVEAAATALIQRVSPLSPFAPIVFGASAATLSLRSPALTHSGAKPRYGMDKFEPERERFVGRLNEMIAGKAALSQAGSQRGILYYGMAGAGKTTLALELAYRYGKRLSDQARWTPEERFQGFVWYKPFVEGSEIGGEFARFLSALNEQLELKENWLLEYADKPAEFNARTLPSLRQLLQNRACLIVLDNMESLLTDSDEWKAPEWEPLINALLDSRNHSRVILTSRRVPRSLANLPQLTRYSVHALSFAETVIAAREMNHLGRMFEVEEDHALLRKTLLMVQGHPKLLELANGIAADRAALTDLLHRAANKETDGTDLQAFLEKGKSSQEEAEFIQSFQFWIADISARCKSATKLLLCFLACVEDADRDLLPLGDVWRLLLMAASAEWEGVSDARKNAETTLEAGLKELTELGLIEAQTIEVTLMDSGKTVPNVRYGMHPAVVQSVLRDTEPALRSTADQVLLELHRFLLKQFKTTKPVENTSAVLAQAKFALSYAVRLQQWDIAAGLAEEIVMRDRSMATLAQVLPDLERAADAEAQSGGNGKSAGILAQTLMWAGRWDEAETRLRRFIKQAIEQDNYWDAFVAAGALSILLQQTGRAEEALLVINTEMEYARQAGMGPWTLLFVEIKRLQLDNVLGRSEKILVEGQKLRERMAALPETIAPEQQESVTTYTVRESLLGVLNAAALDAGQYEQALAFNAKIIQSVMQRNADELDVTRHRFHDYGALLHLHRFDEARRLLQHCREVYTRKGQEAQLGSVYAALADLEGRQGDMIAALEFGKQGLLHSYRAGQPNECAISHNNLVAYLDYTSQPAPAHAHRLAALLLMLQIRSGHLQNLLPTLSVFVKYTMPPTFEWIADMVEQVPGVRFREMWARLPKPYGEGDAAIAKLWEMERQTQAQWNVALKTVANVSPDILAALEADNWVAVNAALSQLPEEQAQLVMRALKDAKMIG